jgi:hypothetical protein
VFLLAAITLPAPLLTGKCVCLLSGSASAALDQASLPSLPGSRGPFVTPKADVHRA